MSTALSGVRADHKYSYRELEKVAAHVREQLKFEPGQAIDALRLFEDLHHIQIGTTGTPIPLRSGVIDLEDSEGYTRYDFNKRVIEILASAQTYDWLEDRHPRAGYFVGHELGHSVLHTGQLVRLAMMPHQQQQSFHRGRRDHKPFEDTEWQANAFAGALLMPARGIVALERQHRVITVSTLVEQFGVSREAAGYRLDLFEKRRDDLLHE
jgi:Zn-dependent peptidase ImmA (M78 family)